VAVDHARGEELRLGQLDDVLGPVLRQHGLDLVRVLGHSNNSAVLDDDQPVLDELDEARAPRVRVDEAAADRELPRVRRERGQLFFERGHSRRLRVGFEAWGNLWERWLYGSASAALLERSAGSY
jgi:hypothetical protein